MLFFCVLSKAKCIFVIAQNPATLHSEQVYKFIRQHTEDMEFGSEDEHVAAKRVEDAYELLYGLCAIHREIASALAQAAQQYNDFCAAVHHVVKIFLELRGIVRISTDPLFSQPIRMKLASQLLETAAGSMQNAASTYDNMMWPMLRAIVLKNQLLLHILGQARTLHLPRETSGMQEDVHAYVEALHGYVLALA